MQLPEETWKQADHQLELWLKRTRRACRAAGVPFRYIAITSDMDGKTGEYVRVHHHAVVNAEAAEIALGKWTAGEAHCEHLYDEVDYWHTICWRRCAICRTRRNIIRAAT